MSSHELARRVAILNALQDRINQAYAAARRDLGIGMETGDRVTIVLADQKVGSATLAHGSTRAAITDNDAFTAWVSEHYPEEVVTTRRVRSNFQARALAASKAAGAPCVDGTLDVPGITVSQGEPYLQLRAEKDAGEVIAGMWTRGEIDLRPLLELPGGEG